MDTTIIIVLVISVIVLIVLMVLFSAIRIVQQYERGVSSAPKGQDSSWYPPLSHA